MVAFGDVVGRAATRVGVDATGEKAVNLLSWTRHSNEEAIVATAESLIAQGLLKV